MGVACGSPHASRRVPDRERASLETLASVAEKAVGFCCEIQSTLLRSSVDSTSHLEGRYQISRQIAVASIIRATLVLVGQSRHQSSPRQWVVSVLCSGTQGQRRPEKVP